jgi:hypothetical protein
MSAMASEQEKIAYLEEHISYEVVVLNSTTPLCACSPRGHQPRSSSSTATHTSSHLGCTPGTWSRFFLKSLPEYRNASDYVPDFEAPGQARLQQVLFLG